MDLLHSANVQFDKRGDRSGWHQGPRRVSEGWGEASLVSGVSVVVGRSLGGSGWGIHRI